MRKLVILIILTSLLLVNCVTSSNEVIYEKELLTSIDSWNISFQYEALTIEKKTNSEEKEIREGHSSMDIKFLNDLYFKLKEAGKYKIAKSGNEGNILLHLTRKYPDMDYDITCDVLLTDNKGIEIGRFSASSKPGLLFSPGQKGLLKITYLKLDEFLTY